MKKHCKNCTEYGRCKDSYASWLFFIIGLISAIAMRVMIILLHLNPLYGKMAWYIGVTGFAVFFIYKFNINQEQSKRIQKHDLIHKINEEKKLAKEDYTVIAEILCSLSSKKERINYFVIFGLSAVALLIAVYTDFF